VTGARSGGARRRDGARAGARPARWCDNGQTETISSDPRRASPASAALRTAGVRTSARPSRDRRRRSNRFDARPRSARRSGPATRHTQSAGRSNDLYARRFPQMIETNLTRRSTGSAPPRSMAPERRRSHHLVTSIAGARGRGSAMAPTSTPRAGLEAMNRASPRDRPAWHHFERDRARLFRTPTTTTS